MNKLPKDKQALVLSGLVEGASIRSLERITGVHRDTIMRLLIRSGEQAKEILDDQLKDLNCRFVEVDEIWCYVGKKQKMCSDDEKRSGLVGDQYVYVAIDSDTKLVPLFLLGKRTSEYAHEFMEGLNEKLSVQSRRQFQLSTDSFAAYFQAVYQHFDGVDYAQIHKNYGAEIMTEKRYSPARLVSITITPMIGEPIPTKISTSHVERQNLTMRMQMRRFTRLTNAFSKKKENLQAALSLHFYHYNFMRLHRSIRMTPAMKAGVAKSIWGWEKILS